MNFVNCSRIFFYKEVMLNRNPTEKSTFDKNHGLSIYWVSKPSLSKFALSKLQLTACLSFFSDTGKKRLAGRRSNLAKGWRCDFIWSDFCFLQYCFANSSVHLLQQARNSPLVKLSRRGRSAAFDERCLYLTQINDNNNFTNWLILGFKFGVYFWTVQE